MKKRNINNTILILAVVTIIIGGLFLMNPNLFKSGGGIEIDQEIVLTGVTLTKTNLAAGTIEAQNAAEGKFVVLANKDIVSIDNQIYNGRQTGYELKGVWSQTSGKKVFQASEIKW